MIVKAQILIAVTLLSGTLFAGMPVTGAVFTALDVETTGFSPAADRLIEIGAVRFRGNGEILAVTNWLINPGRDIPVRATEVHSITAEMVREAPAFATVWPQFAEFCGDSILLAHNAAFDAGFLRAELERAGIAPPAFRIGDTLRLFRRWFPQAPSHALEPLSRQLGAQDETWHRAEADAFHLIRIFSAGLAERPDLTLEQMEQDAGGFKRLDGREN